MNNAVADTIIDTGGIDTVRSTITRSIVGMDTATLQIEYLTLTGAAAINGTGNALNNVLVGNGASNILSGLAGNDSINGGAGIDTLIGGDGTDIYYADVAGDIVQETNAVLATGGNDIVIYLGTAGTFTLAANIERLALAGTAATNATGNALNNALVGNAAINTLDGLAGRDAINGGLGNDVLTGGLGVDAFLFSTALGATNRDTITDFSVVDDSIWLDNAIFTALGAATGALAAGAFNTGAAATQADDRIIYNTATGVLLYDADGNGATAATQFATLTNLPTGLTSADFTVI
jgi:Ca2+-binding RTX toxin-like protein